MQRSANSGPVAAVKVVAVTVSLGTGAAADYALAADANFIGADAVVATFDGAPEAGLEKVAIMGAWVDNPTTGVVRVRLGTIGDDASGDLALRIVQVF